MPTLGLMCGAGALPARMTSEARRQGWRVVAFAFPGAADLSALADTLVATRIEAMGPVIEALAREKVTAVAFSGKFWMGDLLAAGPPDAAHARMAARAGALVVKAVAPGHDFRFDTPAIGPETVEAAALGGATALAVEAGRVLVLEGGATVRCADAAGMALVSAAGDD